MNGESEMSKLAGALVEIVSGAHRRTGRLDVALLRAVLEVAYQRGQESRDVPRHVPKPPADTSWIKGTEQPPPGRFRRWLDRRRERREAMERETERWERDKRGSE